jgi:predicted lipase
MSLLMNLVDAAEAAYQPEYCASKEFVSTDGIPTRIIQLHEDHEKKPRGFIRITPAATLIAIAGTQDIEDAFKDCLVVREVYLKRFEVHKGFFGEHEVVWPTVQPYLTYGKPLYVTGHSLGGAIATLLATSIKTHYDINPIVATFGSPEVGEPAYAKYYNDYIHESTRVVHAWDIVPRWPRGPLWQHVDKELHLSDTGRTISPVEGWFRKLLYWRKVVEEDLKGVSESDHHISCYRKVVNLFEERKEK